MTIAAIIIFSGIALFAYALCRVAGECDDSEMEVKDDDDTKQQPR